MEKAIQKAKVLLESLPYIRTFCNKTFVIKFGGNAMVDDRLSHSFALDMILLSYVGIRPVIVHGGGPQIGEFLDRLGMKTQFVDGLRVTDKETIEIVEMVLVGKINKEIVSCINQHGGRAVGLSGKDGQLITAQKMKISDRDDPAKLIDIGMVGKITGINPHVIDTLDTDQFIPVIAPLGAGDNGETFNINADTAAGEIAAALNAEKLILLTDVEGVQGGDGKLLSSLTEDDVEALIDSGQVSGGMIPKVRCCCHALDKGVGKAHIIDGRVEHAVLLEIFTDGGVGSQIVKS
ncbi:MAG: acetylglutamate kinase [Deltaproteobacteria bacterium]|nr:acetylglutamate kinase [Deltaproteobacteria bacterium]